MSHICTPFQHIKHFFPSKAYSEYGSLWFITKESQGKKLQNSAQNPPNHLLLLSAFSQRLHSVQPSPGCHFQVRKNLGNDIELQIPGTHTRWVCRGLGGFRQCLPKMTDMNGVEPGRDMTHFYLYFNQRPQATCIHFRATTTRSIN